MPNPMVHIDFARQAAECLDHPVLNRNLGYVALGSTAPDVRAITGKPREEYHFATLDFKKVGVGADGLFKAYPELRDPSIHSEATRAFIAGYISHLITDETWIMEMFRPYFGNPDVFENDVLGLVMDRALQLEMDRQSRPVAQELVSLMNEARTGVSMELINPEVLDEWCDWVLELIGREFSMERLRFMARRIAKGSEDHPAYEMADQFIGSMPESLDRLYERVPAEIVETFKRRAVSNLVETMDDYLS